MKKLTQKFSQWLLTAFLLAGLQFNSNAQTATHLNFDGANDYVDCGSILPASYTKEAWIRISNLGAINNIISGGASDGSHAFWAHTGYGNRLSAGHNLVWDQVQDPTPLLANIWYHVAVTYDAATTTMRLYKNGTLVSTNTSVPPFSIGNKVRLGAYGDATYLFQGDMDEVRIWNFARSQAAISASMNSELVGNESGLTAYYKFNQGIAAGNNTAITTLTNATANPFNGSIINFALTGATSNFLDGSPALPPTPATHLHFDGTNDFVRCGTAFNAAFSSRNTVTLEAWVRSETTTGNGVVAGNFSGADNNIYMQFFIRRDGANYVFWILNSTNTAYVNVTAANAVVVNTWQHVVGVRNGDQLLIYINGVLVNTTTGVGTHNFTANTGNEFTIGGNARPFLEFFRGDIDEVRVWTTALSATEIARRKNCELQGNEAGLYAYYKFNQGDAGGTNTTVTTLTNSTAVAGLNGALTNMALTGTTSNWVAGSPVITGSTIPAAPSANAQSFCIGSTVANLVPAPSATINWYNAPTGGTVLAGSTALATGTYYVAAVNANGCESGRTSVTITINALPPPPIASAQSFCGSGTVANLSPAPSATIRWYNVATGGTALPGSTVLSSGTYFVASVNVAGCESSRTAVSITVNTIPDPPIASPQIFCGTSTVANLIPAPSTSIRWYNVPTGGTALSGVTALVTGTYYVSQLVTGCESNRTSVSITINSVPAAPVASNQVYAGSGTIADLTATGTNLQWYDNLTGGTLLPNTTSLIDGTTYYVSQTIVCESPRTPVHVKKISEATQMFCNSSTVADLVTTPASGLSAVWYNAASGGTALANSAAINTGTYYVAQLATRNVSTFAGSIAGSANGTGTAAQFHYPQGVAVDVAGNLYVADATNHQIRKITPAGVVTTFAGSTQGYADGTGTAARFNYPRGVALDAAGNVYVADGDNHRIRKITPAGVVTTFAGSTQGYADGTGTAARFSNPWGITLDIAGNLYIGEYGNHKIRKITSAGVVTTLAGSTQGYSEGTGTAAQFNYPAGVAVDASGDVYVADISNHRIRKITPTGEVSTFAGSTIGFANGAGAAARFSDPWGLTIDADGNFYVADFGNSRIRKINAAGVVTTFTGSTFGFANGSISTALFSAAAGITLDANGNFYFSDYYNQKIRKIAIPDTSNRVGVNISTSIIPTMAMANVSQTLSVGGTTSFNNACANLITALTPNGTTPINGNTTAKVWIESIQSLQFVKRHYEITPASNATTATGRVTLYFTQADFSDFNAVNSVDLPTGPADATGKANLLIEKRSGVSSDGSGLPGTYTGSVITIDPVDADIIWNSTYSRWEVSFDVTGFSGFFVKTQALLLPISLINFTASKQVNDNVLLQWLTANEINFNRFEVQRSTNGSSFENIGMVTARNAGGNNNYQLNDNTVWTSDVRYYRLKMIDNDGTFKYSPVIRLSNKQLSGISIYPNPSSDVININLGSSVMRNSMARLIDVTGRVVKSMLLLSQTEQMNIKNLAPGAYVLKLGDGSSVMIIKE